jgi:hypothetical protein
MNLFISVVLFTNLIHSSLSVYDKSAASTWAQNCAYGCTECPDDSTCGCTYFTTHALSH